MPTDNVPNIDRPQTGEWNKAQRGAVLAELNRILADSAFSKSKRCGELLRSLVEHALSGDPGAVKERTLGIEVFGRDADYDNNADPIVRRTAGEIRKRLAQYYQELEERQPVKIHLTPGCYLPEFDFAEASTVVKSPDVDFYNGVSNADKSPEPTAPEAHRLRVPLLRSQTLFICLALLLGTIATGIALARSGVLRSSQYLFWRPLLEAKEDAIVCVADDSALRWSGASNRSDQARLIATLINSRRMKPLEETSLPHSVPYVDASVAHKLAGWLSQEGRSTVLEPTSMLSLQELRNRPAVLIGGLDNPWTLSLLSDLRFSLRIDPEQNRFWIRDAQNPSNSDWIYSAYQNGSSAMTDYAVITRFFDKETGNWIVAVAGLGQHGTDAACQFLIDPRFASVLPSGVRSKGNFQMVVKTTVINGNTGPPQLVAVNTWKD